MDFKLDPKVQKAVGIVMAIGTGIFAVANALTEQKKEQEYEGMKRDIAELKSKIQ